MREREKELLFASEAIWRSSLRSACRSCALAFKYALTSLNKAFFVFFRALTSAFSFFSATVSVRPKTFLAFSTSFLARFAIFPLTLRTVMMRPFCASQKIGIIWNSYLQ